MLCQEWKLEPTKRENERQSLCETERRGNLQVETYSTVKSAQRLSATLSIRLRGRVQILDM